jgi:transglutaminase-like putative cysteine protease
MTDRFGNRVVELEVREADRLVSFEVLIIVESELVQQQRPTIPYDEAGHYLEHTRLTLPNLPIRVIARELQEEAVTALDLAQRINRWVYGMMRYKSGITSVATTAGEALELGQGMCQDYSHLMIAICRAAGLPARYVSGHLLGEGGSHAWVEVFLQTERGLGAFAFDPTNNCQPHLGYITVAVGRDYRDVSPTSGSFKAPYSGWLTYNKRAGLTMVEYLNGETVQADRAS